MGRDTRGIIIIFLAAIAGFWLPRLIAYAFDNPSDYARQGYHQCDSPSGWCEKEREEKQEPCGEKR